MEMTMNRGLEASGGKGCLALTAGLDPARMDRRRHLLSQTADSSAGEPPVNQQDAAIALLCNGKVSQALDLERETVDREVGPARSTSELAELRPARPGGNDLSRAGDR